VPLPDRCAGLLVPLFALRSARAWGIGEIGDLAGFTAWSARAGHRLVQLLPIFEMPAGERSPYAALSTFAIDPIYVSLDDVEDWVASGGEAALDAPTRAALDGLRGATAIDYDRVRRVKRAALAQAGRWFMAHEWATGSARAAAFRAYAAAQTSWLDDYAVFRAAQEAYGPDWSAWPAELRTRDAGGVARARAALAGPAGHHAWVQWVAAEQWAQARRAATGAGVRVKGDLPFMVSAASADVWARPAEFACDVRLGAPPDAFNAEGQDWGLPVCRWDVMAASGFAWLRARAARAAELFDAFRIDHVLGFYRMYVVGPGTSRRFVPPTEAEQVEQGERLLAVLRAAAAPATVIGEDLGAVPRYVRRSLAALDVPGYRVLRWEDDAGVFRDPRSWPVPSVATSGTHDTSSLVTWWEDELGDSGRRALAAVPLFAPLRGAGPAWTPAVHATLLDGLYAAASALAVLPFPDAAGERARINVPATVGAANWGYRLPWTVEELAAGGDEALAGRLAALARRHGR
jgi:4-alpha-glucanotransferase